MDDAAALALSQRLDLTEITGRVLAGRGIALERAPAFLTPRLKDWLPIRRICATSTAPRRGSWPRSSIPNGLA